ncbi:uncharacterized protein [Leptinotarsa decemlineata]|uniref:uncharacterized protein n=1 Tax=Leptinotarsa decemlineata TaxID=7539 RepID=UPI003D305C3E
MSEARAAIAPMNMEGNIAENWRFWKRRFQNYIIASELNKKTEQIQCAQMLHLIGEEGFKIQETFTFTDEEKVKLQVLLDKFEVFFLPKENLVFEIFSFISIRQKQGQTLDQFITTLMKQAKKCKLGDLENLIVKAMITVEVSDEDIRQRLLEDGSISLEKTIETCRSIEKSKE